MKTTINADTVTVSIDGENGNTTWTMSNANSQVERNMVGMTDTKHPFFGMSKGDVSAATDAQQEFKKKVDVKNVRD